MRVVLDTNVYVSGLMFHGKPEVLLNMARAGRYELILTADIYAELERIFLDKFDTSPLILQALRATAVWISPGRRLQLCADPDDDKFLEAAVAGKAAYLVSGDKHLLTLKRAGSCEIVTVSAMLEILSRG